MSVVEKPKGEPFDNGPKDATGQYLRYAVLPSGERREFTRPFRDIYTHVGIRPVHPTRPLTCEEAKRYSDEGYVKFEVYPSSESPNTGKFWTEKELNSGCNTQTHMGRALSETYAVDPTYYSHTFCVKCREHLPVGQFKWLDGSVVGS